MVPDSTSDGTPAPVPGLAGAPASPSELDVPQPGQRWADEYLVESTLSDPTGATAWKAVHLPTDRRIQLRMLRSADPLHDQAWALLETLNSPRLLRALGARKAGEHRVELFDLPPGQTLRAWRSGQPSVSRKQVEGFLHDMLEALESLHGVGLFHGHIDSDSFFVNEGGSDPRLVLGHLERAAQFQRTDLLPVSGDPFYEPPEAAGLYRHAGGEGLLAWDWWSIGRVIQELILGRHVCDVLIGRTLSRSGLHEHDYAESILLEKSTTQLRPGAVEAMQGLDQRLELLLRGLLAASRDARWRGPEVRSWLAGESPRERYSLGRNERVFRWRGRACTVREAAELLRTEENWEFAADQIVGTTDPATLASFIHEVQSLRPIANTLDATLKILDDPELQDFPREAVEEMVIALALTELAGGLLVWRGRRVDAALLRETLQGEDGSGHALACVWTLASVPLIAALEKTDAEAVRILLDGSHLAKKALDRAWKQGWLAQNNIKGTARIWELAFSSPALWQDARAELRRVYACSTNEVADHIFQTDRPGNDDALLLAFIGPNALRLGFITHEEWERRQYHTLFARGTRLAEVLFWKRLARVLRSGPWCLGHLLWLALGWTTVGLLIAIGWPGPHFLAAAFLPGVLAVVLRFGIVSLVRRELARHAPANTWRFRDNPSRCDAATAATHEHTASLIELESDLGEINSQISQLTRLAPTPAPVALPSSLRQLRLFSWLSWVLWGGLLALCGWRFHAHPPSMREVISAWTSSEQPRVDAAAKNVKQPWPFKAPDYVRSVTPSDTRDARSADIDAAESAGQSFTQDYVSSTISAPTLVAIPSAHDFAFMIYDGKRGNVATKTVYHLRYLPEHGTWLELGGKQVMMP